MKLVFQDSAKAELKQAQDYYDSCETGLGLAFTQEVQAATARIIQFPMAWASNSSRTRRCLLDRFPYALIYWIKDQEIEVVAVAPLKRRPYYWAERLRN